MLIIKISENELKFFDVLQSNYPENVLVRIEHGFDMNSSVQIVIDLADILEIIVPTIVASIEMAILYRIQKKQVTINEKEVKLNEEKNDLEKEKLLLEKAKHERNEFEIRISSNGESNILVKTSDIISLQDNPENLPQFIDNLREALSINEKTL